MECWSSRILRHQSEPFSEAPEGKRQRQDVAVAQGQTMNPGNDGEVKFSRDWRDIRSLLLQEGSTLWQASPFIATFLCVVLPSVNTNIRTMLQHIIPTSSTTPIRITINWLFLDSDVSPILFPSGGACHIHRPGIYICADIPVISLQPLLCHSRRR